MFKNRGNLHEYSPGTGVTNAAFSSFKSIGFLNLGKMIFKAFYHIWSCDRDLFFTNSCPLFTRMVHI